MSRWRGYPASASIGLRSASTCCAVLWPRSPAFSISPAPVSVTPSSAKARSYGHHGRDPRGDKPVRRPGRPRRHAWWRAAHGPDQQRPGPPQRQLLVSRTDTRADHCRRSRPLRAEASVNNPATEVLRLPSRPGCRDFYRSAGISLRGPGRVTVRSNVVRASAQTRQTFTFRRPARSSVPGYARSAPDIIL